MQGHQSCHSHDASLSSGLSEGVTSASKERFLVNVSLNDSKLRALIVRAQEVQSAYFAEDYISRISRRSGFRLTLCTRCQDGVDTMLGYVVYRFRPSAVSVVQFATAPEFHGQGHGKKLIKWLIQHSKKANAEFIALSSLQESIGFYQHFGFKRVKVNGISGEDYVEGQVYMEYRCCRPSKASRRVSICQKDIEASESGPVQSEKGNDMPSSAPEPEDMPVSLESEDTSRSGVQENDMPVSLDSEDTNDVKTLTDPQHLPKSSVNLPAASDASSQDVSGLQSQALHFHSDTGPGNSGECPTKPNRWSLRLRAQATTNTAGAELGGGRSCVSQDCSAAVPTDLCTGAGNRRRVWRAARA